MLNFEDIEFPVTLKDITKFEQLNGVSVNIYIFKKKEKGLVLLRLTNDEERHINLLYISEDDNVGHFACIKNSFLAGEFAIEHTMIKTIFAIGKFYMNTLFVGK